jgi:hypothetical protein
MREEKWEYNEAVRQLFIDFKNACDSVRRERAVSVHTEIWWRKTERRSVGWEWIHLAEERKKNGRLSWRFFLTRRVIISF